MIDWAIDGMMEVHDATVFNNMHDAKADFHYQLFKSEHKSYYGARDLEILDECRAVANVGWLRRLLQERLSRHHRPLPIDQGNLAEIDVSKAYTGACIRIRAVPVLNKFDIWQPYQHKERINRLNLYLVEADSFDLFFNKRYKLCYG
ncbi:MAG: hypothetical protein ACKPKO_10625 [Candidatus Fonsibacter sp.]